MALSAPDSDPPRLSPARQVAGGPRAPRRQPPSRLPRELLPLFACPPQVCACYVTPPTRTGRAGVGGVVVVVLLRALRVTAPGLARGGGSSSSRTVPLVAPRGSLLRRRLARRLRPLFSAVGSGRVGFPIPSRLPATPPPPIRSGAGGGFVSGRLARARARPGARGGSRRSRSAGARAP